MTWDHFSSVKEFGKDTGGNKGLTKNLEYHPLPVFYLKEADLNDTILVRFSASTSLLHPGGYNIAIDDLDMKVDFFCGATKVHEVRRPVWKVFTR